MKCRNLSMETLLGRSPWHVLGALSVMFLCLPVVFRFNQCGAEAPGFSLTPEKRKKGKQEIKEKATFWMMRFPMTAWHRTSHKGTASLGTWCKPTQRD